MLNWVYCSCLKLRTTSSLVDWGSALYGFKTSKILSTSKWGCRLMDFDHLSTKQQQQQQK